MEDKITNIWRNCKKCAGRGLTQIGPDIRGVKICPFCKGTGRVETKGDQHEDRGSDLQHESSAE